MQMTFERQSFRAGNSPLCGSFDGPPSTSHEIIRCFALWLAFFANFTGDSSVGGSGGSLPRTCLMRSDREQRRGLAAGVTSLTYGWGGRDAGAMVFGNREKSGPKADG